MKLGIVGLPNVGKSTLFNSLTKAGAESANYPFCTIDPNVGIVTVPDERLKLLGDMYLSLIHIEMCIRDSCIALPDAHIPEYLGISDRGEALGKEQHLS